MDPLNNFVYPYPAYAPPMTNEDYYGVKPETYTALEVPATFTEYTKTIDTINGSLGTSEAVNVNQKEDKKEEEEDSKANIKLIVPRKRGVKTGKTSDYWVKKITDKSFPFYGCTICNISFPKIEELDKHVTIHEGRLTSYDIRMYNKKKKKEKLRQMKKMKKLSKALKKEGVKKEEWPLEIEIKPEDGYIGNEKATEFNENKDTSNNDGENKDGDKKAVKVVTKYGETSDPRLHKLFKCFACQKQFSLGYYLRLHVRSHVDEKPYVCSTCGQSFITASKLGRHTKRMHIAPRYQCRVCHRCFSRFELLQKHFDKKHEDAKLPEGEPYDYNAILPYLKELEEQLKEKEMAKPKPEDPWGPLPQPHETATPNVPTNEPANAPDKIEVIVKSDGDNGHSIFGDNSFLFKQEDTKEFKVPEFASVGDLCVVKEEVDKDLDAGQSFDAADQSLDAPKGLDADQNMDSHFDDDRAGSSGNDDPADEDYFPSGAWAAPPRVEAAPLPLPPPAKEKTPLKLKAADFPRQCEFCDKTINSKQYYKVHLRKHTGERPYKCCICDAAFVTNGKMYRHVMTHENWQEKCKDTIKIEKKIKEEVGEDKPEVKKKRTRRKRGTVAPAARAAGEGPGGRRRPHRCRYCHKTFLRLDTLEVHKRAHQASGDQLSMSCVFCLEEQPDEETLLAHESTHAGPKPYGCVHCGKAYSAKDPLLNHRLLVHKIDSKAESSSKTKILKRRPRKQLLCDICSKPFTNEVKLQKHIVGHSTEKYILRYECPVCAHMFHTKYHVRLHLTTHQKEGLIVEENRADILAMVLQNTRKIPKGEGAEAAGGLLPPDERSRVCNICGQVFQHFYYLEEHLKSHGSKIAIAEDESTEEERKHICPVCNKGFKLNYYLKLHSYTHVSERPYICQQCGKGFITKGKLKRHIETHSGVKKYQCHICYKFFTRPSYLRIHVRTIHGTQDYNFTVLGGDD